MRADADMPNSQIDMVVRHGDGWRVCGDFDKQEGRPDQDVDLYVVVRQGDVVASRKESRFEVEPEGGDFVVGQPAIATAVAIAKEDPQAWRPSPGPSRSASCSAGPTATRHPSSPSGRRSPVKESWRPATPSPRR